MSKVIKNIHTLKEADSYLITSGIEFDDRIKIGNEYLYFIGTPNEEHVAWFNRKEKTLYLNNT